VTRACDLSVLELQPELVTRTRRRPLEAVCGHDKSPQRDAAAADFWFRNNGFSLHQHE
jgi:hypothetical protein